MYKEKVMDEKTFRAVFVLMGTYTDSGASKEGVQKSAESTIRETYGCIDHHIVRILPHEEAVQKPLSLEDVLKVEEPLREWPSPAAIAAHENSGGRWLGKRKHLSFGIDVRISTFYSEGRAFGSYNKSYDSEYLRFGPVDENYNRVPWPKDKEGNLL
jgi:hypothetical protein